MRKVNFAALIGLVLVMTLSSSAQTRKARPKVGETFKECRNCPDMVVVPAGSFLMGSPADEPERRDVPRF